MARPIWGIRALCTDFNLKIRIINLARFGLVQDHRLNSELNVFAINKIHRPL